MVYEYSKQQILLANSRITVTFVDLVPGDDPIPFLIVDSKSLPQYCEGILFILYVEEYINGYN